MRLGMSAAMFLSVVVIMPVLVAEEGPAPPPGPSVPTPSGEVAPTTPTAPSTLPGTVPRTTPGVTPTPVPRTTPLRTTSSASGEQLIDFKFENEQLANIIKIVAQQTKKNFFIQLPITGSFTIYCEDKIPARSAIDILGIILDSLGYTMVVTEDPPLIRVAKKGVPLTGVASVPTKVVVVEEEEEVLGDKYEPATLIVVLRYVTVQDMQNILRDYKSSACIITAYEAGNFLILKDDEVNLKYLLTLIKKVDVPGTAAKVTIYELKHAIATETAALLTELMGEKVGAQVTRRTGATAPPPTPGRPGTPMTVGPVSPTIVGAATPLVIKAEERTNRLIILASEKDTQYILDLVKQLDVEPTEDQYPIRTYVAQYQDAVELAATLDAFVSGQARTGTTRERTTGRTARTRTAGRTAGRTTQAQPAGAPTPAGARGAVTGGTEEGFFLADPATNMILVEAPPQKIDRYMNLLKELDQPQKQVVIEVWVVEVSSKSQLDLGVEFKSAEIGPAERIGPMQNEMFGGSNFDLGLGTLLSGTGFPSSGISLGIRSLTNTRLDIAGKTYYVPNFDTFFRALREDTGFNILSSPKLTTLNYETAWVDVSDEISIAESSITSFATAQEALLPGGVTETYERRPVGIYLEITPQINSENAVLMEIFLEIGSIAGVEDITEATTRPVIANRSTETNVRVDNHQTIVISGLRRADRTRTTSRIPLLGQIPILGLLFSHERTLTVNTNLLVFITPHIVSDTLDMLEMTETLKNQDLDTERPRFQPTKKVGKSRPLKTRETPDWDWKK